MTIEKGITKKTDRYERSFLVTKDVDLFKIVFPDCFVSNPMNLRLGSIWFNDNSYQISVSGYYGVFSIDKNLCSNFWYSYLKTNQLLKIYNDIATGSLLEKRRVHYSELKNIILPIPSTLIEKNKIGSLFEDINNLITLHQRKYNRVTKGDNKLW